ncbi:MAG: hypothetical protein K2M00_09140, partial [Muribaculaceae bacterium]|nr:hypothetical protein [Muribaculaceae bacterium]
IKDDDKRLMKAFFPEGLDKRPAVDIGFVVLMAFGILRPCTEPSRGRDVSDKETLESLKKLRSLIEVLKDDIPRLGSTEKPLVFDEFLNVLDSRLNEATDLAECTPLWLSYSLRIIARACRTTVITEELSAESSKLQGLDMPGIWIDDTDRGDSRFWIFPDNMLMAFCFRRDGMAWTMTPYEFKVRFSDDADYMDYFILIDAHANVDYLLSSDHVIDIGQVTSGSIEYKVNVVTGELKRVMLSKWMLPFPGWFDWREWQRLKPDDPRYREFHAVLKAVYDPESPYSVFFRNVAPVLTDLTNNLVGRDNKYLYVYDRRPKRFRIWERSRDRFTYESDSGEDFSTLSLFELEISEKYPLYAVPVTVKRKTHGNPDMEKLVNILSDAENINEAYILHSERSPYPRLVLPAYGASVGLNMDELKDLGVKKFTSRP